MLNEWKAPAESHGGPIRICAIDDAGRWRAGGMSPPIGTWLPPRPPPNFLRHSYRSERNQSNEREGRTRGWQLEP